MAYFLVLLIADVKAACYNKMSVLCSLYGLLDEYKKLALVVYLAEYITAIHCDRGEIHGDKCYVEHKDIINAYEEVCRNIS